MKIEVFGPGCAKCTKTYDTILEVVKKHNKEADVIKIDDINELVNRGVLSTPAVFIDGVQKLAGRVPDEKIILS
jgi:small redox-active disulfide protein 2